MEQEGVVVHKEQVLYLFWQGTRVYMQHTSQLLLGYFERTSPNNYWTTQQLIF